MADQNLAVVVSQTRKRTDAKNHQIVEFQIDVQVGTKIWVLWKRYSQFLDFHGHGVAPLFLGLEKLPPKLIFHSPEALEDRRKELQKYLQNVVEKPILRNSWEVQFFLEMKKNLDNPIKKKILIPLPDRDFDPTEVAIPWKLITVEGWEVHFATEEAMLKPQADEVTCAPPSYLSVLGAEVEALEYYKELTEDQRFNSPLKWSELNMKDYDAIILPGGHSSGMKQYLESKALQQKIVEFWQLNRPVAAICHGVLLLSRCMDSTGKSVLFQKRTTTLPKFMENSAWYLSRLKYGSRYRTYEKYCEDEVKESLERPEQYNSGSMNVSRGTTYDSRPALVVVDGNYISARWPGDSYLFARRLIERLYDVTGVK